VLGRAYCLYLANDERAMSQKMNYISISKKIYCCWLGMIISIILASTSAFSDQRDNTTLLESKSNRDIHQRNLKHPREIRHVMTLHDEKLTANMQSITVDQAIENLSRVTGIKVVWLGSKITRKISLGFTGRSMEEAIKEILHDESYMLSYAARENVQVITKIIILPASDKAASIHQTVTGRDINTLNEIRGRIMTDINVRKHADVERLKRIDEVREIATLDNNNQVLEKLRLELATNDEPEARLLALTSLNELGSLSTDTLMDTVSIDEDPRVKLRAIDYLIKRIENSPRVDVFLSAFFEDQTGKVGLDH
jgi:hypothetical protein